jgi:hypothetical protein
MMGDKDDIFLRARKKVDPGDCGAPCDEERGGPKRPLTDAEIEARKRKFRKGQW